MSVKKTEVSVLMPVYNGEKYLREAMDSILNQTFSDFEFLIINDGSTDASVPIIQSYPDPRIRLIHNTTNLKLISTLNKGLMLARGEYIARMDCDDIALPRRLERQTAFLAAHRQTALVASTVQLIDEHGAPAGFWTEDVAATSAQAIKKLLPKKNCIAHPSIMGRTSLLQKYGYTSNLLHTEDYELWLRMCGDGHIIEKISEPLLKYRIHPQSITVASNRENYGDIKKMVRAKRGFIRKKIKTCSWNGFATDVLVSLLFQQFFLLQRAFGKLAKLGLLAFGRLLGMLISFFIKKPNPLRFSIFMIFPYLHTGGAERVHADIIACFRDYSPWVFIVSRSNNTAFKKAFSQGSRLLNISFFCANRISCLIIMGCLAEWINRTSNAVVFSCNAFLFYDILPLLSERVKRVDLLHAFSQGTEIYSLPFVPLLDSRVVISKKTADDFAHLYAEKGIAPVYLNRIKIIENKVPVPEEYRPKILEKIKVIYVGRGTEEKRVHLIGRIASKYAIINPAVSFTLVGDVKKSVLSEDRKHCVFEGEIYDDRVLNDLYRDSHIILITSAREGLPLVLMEAMAHGVVPISTNVGAIGYHVHNGINGFLLEERDEDILVEEFTKTISRILADHKEYHRLSHNAYRHVVEKSASNDDFCRAYIELLGEPKKSGAGSVRR